MAGITVNPSLDGYVEHDQSFLSWADLVAAAGTDVDAAGPNIGFAYFARGEGGEGEWKAILRGIMLFDTSVIPDDTNITGATLYLYGSGKFNGASPSTNIYAASPASDTVLVAGDYANVSSVPFCDTAIAYADWISTGFNTFNLNAAGLAAISKTGKTKFSIRNANYDVAAIAPPSFEPGYAAGVWWWQTEKGDPYKPKLVISYPASYTDRVTGLVHRRGPGYDTLEIHLGGLSTTDRLVDLQKMPLPASPATMTQAPDQINKWYFRFDFHDPSPLGGYYYAIINGREIKLEDFLSGNY